LEGIFPRLFPARLTIVVSSAFDGLLLTLVVWQVAALFASWTATGQPVRAAHYRAALLACCDGGQLNDALRLMAAMKTAGIAPDDEMYNELLT
jgi:pentatricopeptide repeat protein